MKYLKKSNRTAPAELIDLFDLQIELLSHGLEYDLVRQYTEIVNSFSKKVMCLIDLARSDYDKFRRILSKTSKEYKKFFVESEEDYFGFGPPILNINPLSKRIIQFYFKALAYAFEKSDEEKFNYFYNELEQLLKKITNAELNVKVVKTTDLFTGTPGVKREARLIQVYHEIMYYLSGLIEKELEFTNLKSEQNLYLARIYGQLHFELIVDPKFEPLMLNDAIDYWEKLFRHLSLNSHHTKKSCLIIARELHIYTDQFNREWQVLSAELDMNYPELVESSRTLISNRDFVEFEKILNQTIEDDNSTIYKSLFSVGTLSLKVSLLRMAVLRVYGQMLHRGDVALVIEMLFARQPINSDFININHDFFPLDQNFLKGFLRVFNNQRHFGLRPLSYDNFEIEMYQVVFIWLYRNTYWFTRRNAKEPHFNLGRIEDGYEANQILNSLRKLEAIGDSKTLSSLPELYLNHKLTLNTTIFNKLIEGEITRITEIIEHRTLNAGIEEQTRDEFIEKIQRGISNFSGLFNLFHIALLGDIEGNEIRTLDIEEFDKTPFIRKDTAMNVSINALDVYPDICIRNFSAKRDSLLAGELRRLCKSHTLSVTEMEEYFLNNNFKGKIIITHYLHVGYELLKEKFDYSNGNYINNEGVSYHINQINSFNDLKFAFVLDVTQMKNLINSSNPKISLKIHSKDQMKAICKIESRFKLKSPESLIGDFFVLK